ncbi:MAG: tetratricopeptide repeat protein [Candidatus Aegiribacteria sp.]|nr:tetratricopeptide repeat protein [Candidatus Aegiribacteria sp.]MBD3294352.1 tetratricopeptide repeat protein [Candidatus Fermentibacteria bacterium]
MTSENPYSREYRVIRGSLLFADISGFTDITEKLARRGKSGIEDLTSILNRFFGKLHKVVRSDGGTVISSAGDSLLAAFSPSSNTEECAGLMMKVVEDMGGIRMGSETLPLQIKIVTGHGCWIQFPVGQGAGSAVFLCGETISRMSSAEETASRGEIISVGSGTPLAACEDFKGEELTRAFTPDRSGAAQGEHRSIATLFVNVTGYDMESPPVQQIQDLYLFLERTADKYGGAVHKVDNILKGGSRIFLLFGAPRSSGKDSLNAVQAGMEIRTFLSERRDLTISLGIDEGYAFAGLIGEAGSRQYTVIGDVVNTAARLADSAADGDISVSAGIHRTTGNHFIYRNAGTVVLKGKDSPVQCYSPARRRIEQLYGFGFVGRSGELGKLTSLIERGRNVVIVEGEAGIGKTRLLREVSSRLATEGYTVLQGNCPEIGETDALFSSLIGNMTGMLIDDPGAARKSKLWKLVHDLDDESRSLAKREPFIGSMLFSLSYPGSDYEKLSPKLRRENLLDGICDLVRLHAEPCCVLLDDLQNATDQDLEAVDYIIRKTIRYTGNDVSFVISRRPDSRVPVKDANVPIHTIRLYNLKMEEQEELMELVLDGYPLETELEELIVERTGGNPFYLLQFLKYLTEEELILLEGDKWKRTAGYENHKLPESVFSMIMARIDRLEARAKECLRIGSVVGTVFDENTVQRVAGRTVHGDLLRCTAAGLTLQSDLSDLEYIFKHTLIREVSYDSILRKRRTRLHDEIGNIMEELHRNRLEALSGILAHHFTMGKNWQKAIRYSIMAGERAAAEYRNQNALERFQDALEIMAEHSAGDPETTADCCRSAGKVYDRLGDYEKALESYERASEESRDINLIAEVSVLIADILYTQGDIEQSAMKMDELEEMLSGEELCNDEVLIRMQCSRAWAHCVAGEIEKAMQKAERAVKLSKDLIDCTDNTRNHKLGFAYNTLATVHWAAGDFRLAGEYYFKALGIARDQGMKREIAVTLGNLGLVSVKMGKYNQAIDYFEKQRVTSMEIGDKLLLASSIGESAMVLASTGKLTKATELLEEYIGLSEEMPAIHDNLIGNSLMGQIKLVTSGADEAQKIAEYTRDKAHETSFEREEAGAISQLALIDSNRNMYGSALSRIEKAEKLARKVMSKSLLFDILVLKVHILLKSGITGDIPMLIEEATSLNQEMGATARKGAVHFASAEHLLALDKKEGALREVRQAIETFRKHGMKPALLASLELRELIENRLEDGDEDKASSLRDTIAQMRDEMDICTDPASPALLLL